ncbi:hypothetical protein BS17DRAFT_292716 [Gyrodon lividus]|nr:hypothetical protein BS17DRAFT_292716 [Gyrodon lividus]
MSKAMDLVWMVCHMVFLYHSLFLFTQVIFVHNSVSKVLINHRWVYVPGEFPICWGENSNLPCATALRSSKTWTVKMTILAYIHCLNCSPTTPHCCSHLMSIISWTWGQPSMNDGVLIAKVHVVLW